MAELGRPLADCLRAKIWPGPRVAAAAAAVPGRAVGPALPGRAAILALFGLKASALALAPPGACAPCAVVTRLAALLGRAAGR